MQLALIITVGFAAIGITDDWIKITTAKRGLTVRQKLLAQLFLAMLVVHFLVIEQRDKPHGSGSHLADRACTACSSAGHSPSGATLVIVGSSNGVNLTDGLDGLAGGCLVFAGAAFVALTYLSGHSVMAEYLSIPHFVGAGELSVLFAAMVGSMLGFLWYNCYPAQVFMGDSGSLPTGALLGLAALVTRQEVLLLIVGGVFVVETLSVIAQVGWFKLHGQAAHRLQPAAQPLPVPRRPRNQNRRSLLDHLRALGAARRGEFEDSVTRFRWSSAFRLASCGSGQAKA